MSEMTNETWNGTESIVERPQERPYTVMVQSAPPVVGDTPLELRFETAQRGIDPATPRKPYEPGKEPLFANPFYADPAKKDASHAR
ncbi:hypothetical protein HY492_00715 [Candidatus Woesearchaeota archaeon]|nr:hypothetical protein [Candidatus Woesearchaeota archaeon]